MLIVSVFVFLLLVLIAVGPGFYFLYYVSKKDDSGILRFFGMGLAGWVITQILVYIPSLFVQNLFISRKYDLDQVANDPVLKEEVAKYLAHNIYLILILAAIYAVTEQLIRFYFIFKSESLKKRVNVLIAFGVGWGLGDSLLLYTIELMSALFNSPQILVFSPNLFITALNKTFYVFLSVFLSVLIRESLTRPNPAMFLEAINWEWFYYFFPFLFAELLFPGSDGVGPKTIIMLTYLLFLILFVVVRKSILVKLPEELDELASRGT